MRSTSVFLVAVTAALGCTDPTAVEEPAATVRGIAYLDRDGNGAPGTADVPIAGSPVSLLLHATGDTVARAQTGSDGSFTLERIPAGSYRLELDLGSSSDSLAVHDEGVLPIVVARGDTVDAQVRVRYVATEVTSIAAARALPAGTRVIVPGLALTASAAFGDSTLHLSDATASIRALRVREAITSGDSVRLTGTIAVESGQPVIVASAAIVLRSGAGIGAPASLSTESAARAANGTLDAAAVTVTGIIVSVDTDASGNTFVTIDDGSGALVLELLRAAGFTGTAYEAGQSLLARGVLVPAADGTRWLLRPRAISEALVTAGVIRCTNGLAGQFACRDVDLLARVTVADLGGTAGVLLNDIWGWKDTVTGREYAIVGRTDGTAFVDVTDPVRPIVVANLAKTAVSPPSTWRDMKVYMDHAFIVADGARDHGMQVVDLTRLRHYDRTPLQLTPDVLYLEIHSAHNIVINEQSGFAYAVGASGGGRTCGSGLHMIDIRNPKTPTFAGCFADPQTGRAGTGYTHDAQCVTYAGPDLRYAGREICFGSNETALSIADVTDRASPRALSRASYPNVAYSHQGWLTADQRYLYMNDELDEIQGSVTRTRTLIWDVADLEDPQLVAAHNGVEATTDHNLYIRGDVMYQANYASGLRILDITARVAPEEVAFFDTTPGANGTGFSGAWSSYPFLDSGVILVSSRGEGLFVLRPR